MRLALLASLSAAALVTPLASCGGDDGDGAITDPGSWLEAYITRLCAKAHECKADFDPPADFEAAWGANEAACKTTFLTPEQVRASVSSGKATFNATAGAQCLSMLQYETQTCPVFWMTNDPAVCTTVFTGTVAADGACANGLECQSGLFCIQSTCQSPGATGPRVGTSQLRAALDGF